MSLVRFLEAVALALQDQGIGVVYETVDMACRRRHRRDLGPDREALVGADDEARRSQRDLVREKNSDAAPGSNPDVADLVTTTDACARSQRSMPLFR
jgi:hypothetical protein